ncbi:uncharacterized protein LOC142346917 isoform X2 [Convolutriloba macropyga]
MTRDAGINESMSAETSICWNNVNKTNYPCFGGEICCNDSQCCHMSHSSFQFISDFIDQHFWILVGVMGTLVVILTISIIAIAIYIQKCLKPAKSLHFLNENPRANNFGLEFSSYAAQRRLQASAADVRANPQSGSTTRLNTSRPINPSTSRSLLEPGMGYSRQSLKIDKQISESKPNLETTEVTIETSMNETKNEFTDSTI